MKKKKLTDLEWRKKLSGEEYRVLRKKGTEPPHIGLYNLHFEKGTYYCKGCKSSLFRSSSKFRSTCGWPTFDQAIKESIHYSEDTSIGMIRTEITCSCCNSHLGHVFNDGPTETGLRYCVNSISINFK